MRKVKRSHTRRTHVCVQLSHSPEAVQQVVILGGIANPPALWGSESWLQPAFSRLLQLCACRFLPQETFPSRTLCRSCKRASADARTLGAMYLRWLSDRMAPSKCAFKCAGDGRWRDRLLWLKLAGPRAERAG